MDWNQDTANIIYASNDGYAEHLAASLYSLMDHNCSIRNMDIYVLSVGMCRECRERLSEIADRFCRGSYVVELGDFKSRFDFDIDTRGFDISAMARPFAPQALPETVTRALYLNCDTIVCQNIRPLCEMDLGDCLVGMVMEPMACEEMKVSIGLQKDDPYCSSGVLLMNLGGWRREDVLGRLSDFYKNCQGRPFVCDQDAINGALKGRIKTLPMKYNCFTNYRCLRCATLCSLCGAYREVGEEAYREAGKVPAAIHYPGDERSWIMGNHNHFGKLYEYYLAKTPWEGTPKQRGKEQYMRMWQVFNRLTWICPPFRLWISRCLGIKLVDSRRKYVKSYYVRF